MIELWGQFWNWAYEQLLRQLTAPKGGTAIVETLGTGYSVEGERMENIAKLKALGEEAVSNPAFAPRDGKTYCNLAARFIAEGMGFFGLPRNALANDMIAFLATAPGWREDSIERAFDAAQKGGLAFIAIDEEPHGHLAAVAPEPKEASSRWGEDVPMIYNVGRTVGLVKLSEAFKVLDKPLLRAFVFEESIA